MLSKLRITSAWFWNVCKDPFSHFENHIYQAILEREGLALWTTAVNSKPLNKRKTIFLTSNTTWFLVTDHNRHGLQGFKK